NSICKQNKGRGCSAALPPYGDDFLTTIGQEIGHQWSGRHTWNRCDVLTDSGGDGERCEPGSGSTIMSYAGACGADNVQGVADLYYHACSIRAIRLYVESGEGSACGFTTATTNTAPMVSIPYNNGFYIPIGTPFELQGTATDADGDVLTYNWDEIDRGPMAPLGSPIGSSPLFRSYTPDTAGYMRTFPRLTTIITNSTNKSEVLPTYTRDLTFSLVARDNVPGGGGIGFDTLAFHATDQAGPFKVASPNTNAVTWHPGEYQLVTWEVANTNQSLVNCQKVNIRLSVNGGLKYPILLAENVANKGKACVLVPNNVGPLARIRVEAADNIFFDISNQNFKILAATQAGFGICAGELATQVCLPTNYSVEISTSGWLGFNDPITLSATGLPAGASATFSPNPVAPGSSSTMTISFAAGTPEGTSDITITGTAGSTVTTTVISPTFVSNDFSALALQTPVDGAVGIAQSPTLVWADVPDADKYEIQVATNPSFAAGTIKASNSNLTVASYTVPTVLEKSTAYYWRVRPVNECNNALWTEAFSFNTLVESCSVLTASDLPKNISANSTPTVESKITVGVGGVLSDVNIKTVQGNHQFFKDLEVHLISPIGTDVLL
ncbi:MAG: reprolysin-like metallopeptidase, partial [Saprospiraceae bacterium]